ncbi:hypothetical protein ACO2Q7_03830 [Rathayibacter sp. KR2-224]|uniref:hypothetical protein n=1 Tax=Rathayibacter sp. KR2-224 TaxID=3400913 RepID=UPI003C07E98C
MKQLLVASTRICAEDAVADAVLEYELVLAQHHRAERVVVPVFVNEGDSYCDLILGRGAVTGSLALPNTSGRRIPGSAGAAMELRERIKALREEWVTSFADEWYEGAPPELG